MMPSCDQTGVPRHFHSSTASGSASLMSLRILPRVFPRQSPSSAILFEMSSDADCPSLALDFFMFSPWKTPGCLCRRCRLLRERERRRYGSAGAAPPMPQERRQKRGGGGGEGV